MPGVSVIDVDGVRVLDLDFSKATREVSMRLLVEAGALVRKQPLGSAFTLSNFTDAQYDTEVSKQLREYTKLNAPHVKFGAVVGVTGIKKAIYRAVLLFSGRTNLVLCDTVDEAKRAIVKFAREH